MKAASWIVAAGLACATSPAAATSTIACTARDWPALEIGIIVGHGAAGAVVRATISFGGEEITTGLGDNPPVIAQAWIDEQELKLDIVDANAEQRLARLVTRRRGDHYVGTLLFRGETIRVRCGEES
jgi:hypothetical protein